MAAFSNVSTNIYLLLDDIIVWDKIYALIASNERLIGDTKACMRKNKNRDAADAATSSIDRTKLRADKC